MTETSTVVESITPSPLGRSLIYGLIGVALGIALGYGVAKILEAERFGHYHDDGELVDDLVVWPTPADAEERAAAEATKAPLPVEEPETAEQATTVEAD
jgi:ABC-type antimicrobial peptide transport system permease subunit